MRGRARRDELDRLAGLLLGLREDPEVAERLGVLAPQVPVRRLELDGAPELLQRLLELAVRGEEAGPQEALDRVAARGLGRA